MHFSTALVSLAAVAASAAPVIEIEQNIVRDDGTTHSLVRRGERHTHLDLGKTYIDYGCDASIKKTLEESIDNLCRSAAKSCDSGSEYSRKVDWTGGHAIEEWPIKVTAVGEYPSPEMLKTLKDIIVNSVTDDTWYAEDVHWSQRFFQHTQDGTCAMTKFANHIKATHWDDDDLQSKLELTVTMEAQEQDPCDLVGDVMTAASAMHSAIGAVSGPLELVICSIAKSVE